MAVLARITGVAPSLKASTTNSCMVCKWFFSIVAAASPRGWAVRKPHPEEKCQPNIRREGDTEGWRNRDKLNSRTEPSSGEGRRVFSNVCALLPLPVCLAAGGRERGGYSVCVTAFSQWMIMLNTRKDRSFPPLLSFSLSVSVFARILIRVLPDGSDSCVRTTLGALLSVACPCRPSPRADLLAMSRWRHAVIPPPRRVHRASSKANSNEPCFGCWDRL